MSKPELSRWLPEKPIKDREVIAMMGLVSDVTQMQSAAIGTQIQTAVTNKVLDSTTALQQDMIQQLFAASGIGGQIDFKA